MTVSMACGACIGHVGKKCCSVAFDVWKMPVYRKYLRLNVSARERIELLSGLELNIVQIILRCYGVTAIPQRLNRYALREEEVNKYSMWIEPAVQSIIFKRCRTKR